MTPPASPAPACPHDGTPLADTGPTSRQTPPWGCASCSRLWWPAQVTPAAAQAWDRDLGGYPPDAAPVMLAALERDRRAKKGRR